MSEFEKEDNLNPNRLDMLGKYVYIFYLATDLPKYEYCELFFTSGDYFEKSCFLIEIGGFLTKVRFEFTFLYCFFLLNK